MEAIVLLLGIYATKLTALPNTNTIDANLNEYALFDELKSTIDNQSKTTSTRKKARRFRSLKFKKSENLLRDFINRAGFKLTSIQKLA